MVRTIGRTLLADMQDLAYGTRGSRSCPERSHILRETDGTSCRRQLGQEVEEYARARRGGVHLVAFLDAVLYVGPWT